MLRMLRRQRRWAGAGRRVVVLGIESTFDDSAVGIVTDQREVLADCRQTQNHRKCVAP
jgi:tRNA A37 threonylcarbamoyltransferase TsaD